VDLSRRHILRVLGGAFVVTYCVLHTSREISAPDICLGSATDAVINLMEVV